MAGGRVEAGHRAAVGDPAASRRHPPWRLRRSRRLRRTRRAQYAPRVRGWRRCRCLPPPAPSRASWLAWLAAVSLGAVAVPVLLGAARHSPVGGPARGHRHLVPAVDRGVRRRPGHAGALGPVHADPLRRRLRVRAGGRARPTCSRRSPARAGHRHDASSTTARGTERPMRGAQRRTSRTCTATAWAPVLDQLVAADADRPARTTRARRP